MAATEWDANIWRRLADMAATRPDQAAIIWDKSGQVTTFARLVSLAEATSSRLAELGVGPGDRVAFFVKPGRDFFVTLFALFRLNAVPVLLDTGMGLRRVGECLQQADPKTFVGIWQALVAKQWFGWPPAGRSMLVGWGFGAPRACADKSRPTIPASVARPDDPAAILFTSGSTGPAKGVVYTHGMFSAQIDAVRDLYGIKPGEVDMPTFPLFALFGPVLGMTVVLPAMDYSRPGNVNPKVIRRAAERHKPTTMFGSPALLDRVADGKGTGRPFASLERLLSAGAPVPPQVLELWVPELIPPAAVHTPYGATEALPVASIDSHTVLNETAGLTAQGWGTCVGRPVAGLDLRIIRISDLPIDHWRDDLVLSRGEVGEIVVKAPWVTREYFGQPEKTRLAKIADGGDAWHRMGDVGYLDDQGRLWYCGRKAHRVELDGVTLFSEQVEGYFNDLSSGSPHQRLRTALVGVIRDGAQRAELVVEIDSPSKKIAFVELMMLDEPTERHGEFSRITAILPYLGRFPVDRRHNAKIERETLAAWAQKQA